MSWWKPFSKIQKYSQKRKQLRYYSQLTILEDDRGSKLIIFSILSIGFILFAFIIWASITPIEEVAVTQGEIIPRNKPFILQHLEGGLIAKIFVKDGDVVKLDQVLIEMDPTSALAELKQMQSRLAGLVSNPEKLKEFIATHNPQDVSTELSRLSDQNLLFTSQLSNLQKKLELQKKELKMYEDLVSKGYFSKRDYLAAQRSLNDTEGEISKVNAEQLELVQTIRKLKDRVNRIQIRSPVHGTIQGLQVKAGSVIQPGGTLMEIVPLHEELVVETKINTTDIGHVKVGDHVTVKVMSYDYSRYGDIKGTLTSISPSTFTEQDEKQTPYYKGIVTLTEQYVGEDKKHRLVPGMTVQADINTGTKTVMQYILKPIYTTLSSSFHER